MDRRGFLKGLAAVGVTVATSPALAGLMNAREGEKVLSYGWDEAGNGWFRVWKTWAVDKSNGYSVDFGPVGMTFDENSRAKLAFNPQLENSRPKGGEETMTFSCYVKAGDGANPIDHLSDIRVTGASDG